MRPCAIRPASPDVYATARSWTPSERRVHRAGLPGTPSRVASLGGRGCMVGEAQHRSSSSRFQALAADADRWRTPTNDQGVGRCRRRTCYIISMLNELMLCEELFHTPSGIAFADFVTDGHRETWPIRSKSFRNWVRRCYYQATGAAAG